MTVIIFLIVLAVLIFVHEFGHFIAARSFGIRVDAFALGFGPKLLSWKSKKSETEYSLRIIPFGGYVKIFGESPDEESISGPDSKRSFVNKPRWQQAIVLAAGITCNFIFAWILYFLVLSFGVTAAQDAFPAYASRYTNERIMITEVMEGSPADKIGLKVGDAFSGKSVSEIQDLIGKSSGSAIDLEVTRKGKILSVHVTPTLDKNSGRYMIGIAMGDVVDVSIPFPNVIWESLNYTFLIIKETAIGLATFLGSIFHGTANLGDVAGPIKIAGIVNDAAQFGLASLVMITALISANLGVINLLPIPALDGGRIVFVIIESIIRRRISSKVTNIINTIGFSLLMLLMVVITYHEISQKVSEWLAH